VISVVLLPTKAEVARHLGDYREWERRLLAHPADLTVRMRFEDTAYTLCVLMGECKARVAADAAELFLRPPTAVQVLPPLDAQAQ
jgi:hypothetical protein